MVTLVPILGILAYLLFGEVNIGRRRVERLCAVLADLPKDVANSAGTPVLERHDNLFRLGQSISGFYPVGGHTARLMLDSNATIDAMVSDIDAAENHVHLLFYIWLPDNNGRKVIEALKCGLPGAWFAGPWPTILAHAL